MNKLPGILVIWRYCDVIPIHHLLQNVLADQYIHWPRWVKDRIEVRIFQDKLKDDDDTKEIDGAKKFLKSNQSWFIKSLLVYPQGMLFVPLFPEYIAN